MLKHIFILFFSLIIVLPSAFAIFYTIQDSDSLVTLDLIKEEYDIKGDDADVTLSFNVFIPESFNSSKPFNITLYNLEVPTYSTLTNQPYVTVKPFGKKDIILEREFIPSDDKWILLFSENFGHGLNYTVTISYTLKNYIPEYKERFALTYFSNCEPTYCPNQKNFEIYLRFYPTNSIIFFLGVNVLPYSFPNYAQYDTYSEMENWSMHFSSNNQENINILNRRHIIWLENENYRNRWELFLVFFSILIPCFYYFLPDSFKSIFKNKKYSFIILFIIFIILLILYLKY